MQVDSLPKSDLRTGKWQNTESDGQSPWAARVHHRDAVHTRPRIDMSHLHAPNLGRPTYNVTPNGEFTPAPSDARRSSMGSKVPDSDLKSQMVVIQAHFDDFRNAQETLFEEIDVLRLTQEPTQEPTQEYVDSLNAVLVSRGVLIKDIEPLKERVERMSATMSQFITSAWELVPMTSPIESFHHDASAQDVSMLVQFEPSAYERSLDAAPPGVRVVEPWEAAVEAVGKNRTVPDEITPARSVDESTPRGKQIVELQDLVAKRSILQERLVELYATFEEDRVQRNFLSDQDEVLAIDDQAFERKFKRRRRALSAKLDAVIKAIESHKSDAIENGLGADFVEDLAADTMGLLLRDNTTPPVNRPDEPITSTSASLARDIGPRMSTLTTDYHKVRRPKSAAAILTSPSKMDASLVNASHRPVSERSLPTWVSQHSDMRLSTVATKLGSFMRPPSNDQTAFATSMVEAWIRASEHDL